MCKVESPVDRMEVPVGNETGKVVVTHYRGVSVDMVQQLESINLHDCEKRPHLICRRCGLEESDCALAVKQGECLLQAARQIYTKM